MEISQHIDAIDRDGELMAAAAERAGLGAPVPGCAPWQVRDLLKHQGYVHRWAASYVAEQHAERMPRLSEPDLLTAGPADADLLAWFRAGHRALTGTLRAADPGLRCWSFLPAPSPLAFWARRQAHETAMHRVDAEQAAGTRRPQVPADFAADGVDELIMGFAARGTGNPQPGQPTLQVAATDAAGTWLIGLTPDGARTASVRRGEGAADCLVTGPAAGLYLLLWHRGTAGPLPVATSGDGGLFARWLDGLHVTWG